MAPKLRPYLPGIRAHSIPTCRYSPNLNRYNSYLSYATSHKPSPINSTSNLPLSTHSPLQANPPAIASAPNSSHQISNLSKLNSINCNRTTFFSNSFSNTSNSSY